MVFTEDELRNLQLAERITSVFSLVGCTFIITTFCAFPAIRKPINRLIFYASFGNILATVATIIAREGVLAGQNSPLCQLQAFFIQLWLPADCLWSFCMALNVHLTFYKRYSAAQLKKLEWKYFLCCYGLPLIPAIALFFIKTKAKGRVFGPATLWCSITNTWQFLRLACFYAPVWLITLGTLAIFIHVGLDVFKADRNFKRYSIAAAQKRRRSSLRLIGSVPLIGSKVPTVETAQGALTPEAPLARQQSNTTVSTVSRRPSDPYSGFMESEPPLSPLVIPDFPTTSAARSYLRYSLLFFVAMVVTWIPSSINRIYSIVNPTATNYHLNLFAAVVLPLQGLWNSLIYLLTSYPILKELADKHIFAPIRQKKTRRSGSVDMPFAQPGRLNSVSTAASGTFGPVKGPGHLMT